MRTYMHIYTYLYMRIFTGAFIIIAKSQNQLGFKFTYF